MTTYPTLLENTNVHVQQRPRPQAQMPHLWQPSHNKPNLYHSSSVDLIQGGWNKWADVAPNMYTHDKVSTMPYWYARRQDNIMHNDWKETRWNWEGTMKPTTKRTYGWRREDPPRPFTSGNQFAPKVPYGQVEVPQWGLYNPPHYIEPSRLETLPPLNTGGQHLNNH